MAGLNLLSSNFYVKMFLFPDAVYKNSQERFSESLKSLDEWRDLQSEVKAFEFLGYAYIQYNFEFKSDLVRTPSGDIMTEEEIEGSLKPLKFGDKNQLKALESLDYLMTARKYYRFKFY